MAAQAGQHMMAVLPCRRRKHQLGLRMDVHEDIHSHALRRDEAVLRCLVVSVRANQSHTLRGERRRQLLFHLPLRRPTCPVGRKPQIAAGHQQHFIPLWLCRLSSQRCHFPNLLAMRRCSASETIHLPDPNC